MKAGGAGSDNARGASASEAPGGLSLDLRSLEITRGRFVLDDEQTGLFASVAGLDHSLGGNFSRDSLVAQMHTRADSATVRFAGVPYLSGVRVGFDAQIAANMKDQRFTLEQNELRLNDLALRFSGTVAREGEDLDLDVKMDAPNADFGQILSLVPTIYAHDFATLQTSGTVSVAGSVHGKYGKSAFPAFALHATVDNGTFHYPDLPSAARDIAADLSIENPGNDPDSTVVSLRRFHAQIGQRPVDMTAVLRTPVSDPDFDLTVKGAIDLADVARTVKLDGVQELTGVIGADAAVRARLSDLDSARYERVSAHGTLSATDVTARTAGLPQPIAVEDARLELTPRRADLKSLHAQAGASDFEATGWVDNLLGFALRKEPLHGEATVSSKRVDLDEWKSNDPQTQVIPVPAMLDLTLQATVGRLTYGKLVMTDARGSVRVKDQRVTLEDFGGKALGGEVGVSGFYETTDPSKPTFGGDLKLDSLSIADAVEVLPTVGRLAPVARFARGAFTADLDLSGALGHDLTPLLDVLNGKGSLSTSTIALQGFPPLRKLADAMKIPQIGDPTFNAIRSSIEIHDGRLFVHPFQVRAGNFAMTVSGSNGVDQSLDYTLGLAVPRALLGSAAGQVVQSLVSTAGKAGIDLEAADSVRVDVRLAGSVTDPSVKTDFAGAVASGRQEARKLADEAVQNKVAEAGARADSAREEARRKAQARADSIVAEARTRADSVRAEADRLAESVRAEGNRRADQVLAEAKNPIAKAAARPVADRIRKEASDKADEIVRQADQKADGLVAEARKRADALVGGG